MSDNSTLLQNTKAVLTNELRLHGDGEARMAIKFGEGIQKQDKENAYLTLRFKATNSKADFIIDRHLLNFVCPVDESGAHPQLTFNDYKIWNETNDGPNSGLNADLLDGRHATEFKDRYGYHHFVHQVNKNNTDAKKNWVKIATFTTRRIGTRTDLDYDKSGNPAYGGIFQYSGNGVHGVSTDDVVIPGGNIKAVTQALAAMDIREQFKLNTPQFLDEYDPDVFHTTNILTEGVYNGTLRGCVTLLKNDNPTTFDFHVGLFEDPVWDPKTKETEEDGGFDAVKKYFYVSLHDETLPFLTDDDVYTSPNDDNLNKGYDKSYTVNKDTDDINKEKKNANGVVENRYTLNNPNYPNFPYYNWDYKYNNGRATKTYSNDVSDNVCSIPAMANLCFTKPDGKKAEMLRELKTTFGNDCKIALETEMSRLKELGLAMSVNDDEYEDGSSSSDKDTTSTEFKLDGLDKFKSAVEDGNDNVKSDDDVKEDINKAKISIKKTDVTGMTEIHTGPLSRIDIEKKEYGDYKQPPATMQDVNPYKTRRRQPFPASNVSGEGDAYQTYIDIMRLYHVNTKVETIDGLQVITHFYELYMAIDEKMEIRVQPYMSNACLMYNFNECIQTSDLPNTPNFIRPKSIYDSRYASVRHRHYDYERRIWELTLEADQIWKNFKNYLPIDQGTDNANKVMVTDKDGKIYAAEDNMVRHCEPTVENPDTKEKARRTGGRVLITSDPDTDHNPTTPSIKTKIENSGAEIPCSCIEESAITLDELYQLDGVTKNIQQQIDALWSALDSEAKDIWGNIGDVWGALDKLSDLLAKLQNALNKAMGNFVKKTGDTMTGGLWMDVSKPSTFKDDIGRTGGIPAFGFVKNGTLKGYTYGGTNHCDIGWATGPAQGDWCVKWYNNNFAIKGTTIAFGDVDSDSGEYSDNKTKGCTLNLETLRKVAVEYEAKHKK